MSNSSATGKTGTATLSGFSDLNIFDFIKGHVPANVWPARLRISGKGDNGRVAAKLHYVDVDGTDPQAVNECLSRGTELPLTEIDCEVDIMGLLASLDQLDVVMPNTAALTGNHTLSIRR